MTTVRPECSDTNSHEVEGRYFLGRLEAGSVKGRGQGGVSVVHVAEDFVGFQGNVFFGVVVHGQAGFIVPEEITDRDPDGVSGRLLFAPMVGAELSGLERLKKVDGNVLDPFGLERAQFRLPEDVEDGQ